MAITALTQFVGGIEQYALLRQQLTNNFLSGRIVQKIMVAPETVNYSVFKQFSAEPYRGFDPVDSNISSPSIATITPGDVGNVTLMDIGKTFLLTRRFTDSYNQALASASNAPAQVKAFLKQLIVSAGLQGEAITHEKAIAAILNNPNSFSGNIIELSTPVDSDTSARGLVLNIKKIIKKIQLDVGGSGTIVDDKGNSIQKGVNSPIKVVIPYSLAIALESCYEQFNVVMPANGSGNEGNARVAGVDFLSEIFGNVDVVIPQAVTVTVDGVKLYDDALPGYLFEENAITVVYAEQEMTSPASLVLVHTPIMTDVDKYLNYEKTEFASRFALSTKRPSAMYKLTKIVSPALWSEVTA